MSTLAGAFMRFPLGILSQYIWRKKAAILEMSMILLAMAYGYFLVRTFNDVLAMGVLLGIAGAGNSGTVLATLFAPVSWPQNVVGIRCRASQGS